jgi:hypothetical protein
LFYHDVITFGTTTLPTLQTTLVRAIDTDGVVITTASGAIVCQSEESGNLKVPRDLVCNNTVIATALEAATVETTLITAGDTTGLFLTTSSGAVFAKSAENGNLIVPQDLQCTYKVSAATVEAATLETTLIKAGDTTGLFLTTSSGAVFAKSDESGNLLVPQDLQCTFTVSANAFNVGAFRLFFPIPNVAELQYNGQRVCRFGWNDGTPSLLVDTIKAAGADRVTVSDNLHVTGNLTVDGGVPSIYWVAGTFDFSSPTNSFSQKGRHAMTVSRIAGDLSSWQVSFPSHPDGARYTILVSSAEYHTIARFQTATGCVIYTRKANNAPGAEVSTGDVSVVVLA